MESKPIIWKAVLTALLGFVVFTSVTFILMIIFGFLFLGIPIIENIIRTVLFVLSWFRLDAVTVLSSMLSVSFAFSLSSFIIDKLCNDDSTNRFSLLLLGIFILVFQIPSLILNLFFNIQILPLQTIVVSIFSGIIFIWRKDE